MFHVKQLAQQKQVIDECKTELAGNTDESPLHILSYYGGKIGLGVNAMRRAIAESSGMPFTVAAFAGSQYVAAGQPRA